MVEMYKYAKYIENKKKLVLYLNYINKNIVRRFFSAYARGCLKRGQRAALTPTPDNIDSSKLRLEPNWVTGVV
jgi:lysine/ornithine N-monooxygenase